MAKKRLVTCPLCHAQMGEKMLSCHIVLDHSKKEVSKFFPNGMPSDLNAKVPCPVCGDMVMARRIPRHIKRMHPPEPKKQKLMTAKQRMYAKLYPDKRPLSNDLLDTNLVVSGGGIGVGKGKKS